MTHTVTLTQSALIHQILDVMNIAHCHSKVTPPTLVPLGSDDNSKIYGEVWSYSSMFCMLLYLASNTHPDLAFAVNPAVHYLHCP